MKRYISLLLAFALLLSVVPVLGVSAVEQELASVSVTSDRWRLVPGQTAQLSAKALDAEGNPIEGAVFEYLSMDTSIATVDNKGFVTSLTYGVIEVLVKATVGEITIPKLVRLTVAEPTDREDFEMEPGSVPDCFASGSIMAEISDEAGKNSAMSAKLYDTATNSAALLRFETGKAESLNLVFDVLTKSTAVQFRISNGGRGTANTAFWIRVGLNQLQYYNGKTVKWENLGTYNSIANKWTTVRVEADVTGDAKVYVGGEFIGAVPRTEGDYSGNATTMIDSVVFEAGDAGTTGSLFYIDNLKLSPRSSADGETFDKQPLNATPENVPGYVAHNAASIKTAPGAEGNKALMMMGSKNNEGVPTFEYSFATAQKMTVEFDVYLESTNNLLTFQLYNGTKAYGNTVFFLQFNFLYGLRVYDGKWTALNADAKLLEKEWNHVRLEITAGQNAQAQIYLNDKHVATTSVAYNKKDTINGINFFMGTKEQTCYLDNLKINAPVNESFDGMEQVATPDVLEGCTEFYAATIKADPVNKGEKALHLSDPTGAKTPGFMYQFEGSDELEMEFDVLIPSSNNSVTFQLVNGSRVAGKTAFWLQFNYAYGLRAYTPAGWQTAINADAKLKVGQWNNVRLAVTAGETAQVTVYLNGENVGTIDTKCSTQDEINGFYIFPGAANMSCYLDNLKVNAATKMEEVTPDSIVQDFEGVEMEKHATIDAIEGLDSTYAASITADPVNAGQMALYLADSTAADYPHLYYTFASSSQLSLEYDVYLPSASTAITFQILNGTRSNSNTAFWLQFSTSGLRVYNGAWSVVNADAKLNAGSWNKVRVDLSMGTASEAKIFLNGTEVGTTAVAMNQKSSVNGIYLFLANKAHTCYVDNIKVTPAAMSADFENLEVDSVPDAPFANVNTATVVMDTSTNKTKVVHLKDTSATAPAQMRAITEKTGEMEIEFDAKGVSGAVQFYITNGARNSANTAYWLQISGKNVQYYNGSSWVTLKTRDVYITTWTNVRVVANMQSAEIYVNGELMGVAQRAGGSYGSAVTDTIDSVAFVSGSAASASNNNYYLDNVKLTPKGAKETFEGGELQYGATNKLPGYVADNATVIKPEPGLEGNKALYLSDATAADYPNFFYNFDASDKLTLEFDVYPTDAKNAVTFQILNGARTTANTAFWLQIGNSGLRVYNGSGWSTVNADTKLTANSWNTVRVELAVGEASEAKIYINGKMAGTTQATCSTQATVDGLYLFLGNKTDSVYLDNLKVTPAALGSDFEDLEVDSVPGAPFADANMTVVSNAKAMDSGKSVYMADTIAEQTALLRLSGKKSATMIAEFDMLPVSGSVQFRLLNGARNTANTGFWINFTNKAVDGVYYTFLQYYSGTAWVELYRFEATLANKWHHVRVEATAGANALIYVDGVMVGTAPAPTGSYGTAAKTELDGIVFECGDSKYASWKFYLDNVYLSSAADENFDAQELKAAPTSVKGYKSHYAASVQEAPGAKVNHILELVGSSANTAVPSFQYAYSESYDKLSLSFDIYPLVANSTATFQIYNATKSYADTAFLMQFGGVGLRAYVNGTGWQPVVNANAKLTAKKWNNVRIDMTLGENSVAEVYLNGELVGTIDTACSMQDVVKGFYIFSGNKEHGFYLDNLTLTPASYMQEVTPEPVDVNFEDVALSASVESLLGYVGHKATVITTDPANADNLAVFMNDAEGQTTPYFEYAFGANNKVTLEFDAYIPTAENSFAFQIYSGSKAYANTAFFLQFNYEEGLRVYNGAWSVVNADAKLTAAQWNKIRVELTTGSDSQAKIYVNNKLVGTTKVAFNKVDTVDGFYIFAGSAKQSVYMDNLKITAPVTETFNSLAVNQTPESLPGYVAHVYTTIKSDPGIDKAVYLSDSSEQSVPFLDYAFDPHSDLKLEFETYIPSSGNTVTFKIYNGSKADMNTGYMLQFNHEEGLRVYNGEWSTISKDVKLSSKKWHKVRVEISSGEENEAKIYLNGKLVGTTTLALNKMDIFTGMYVTTGSETQSCYIDDIKVSGTAAEAGASDEKELLETQMGDLFDIADNTEKEGLPVDDAIIKEDFRASFGEFGFTQIPNVVYDPDTDLVYVNYNRHRDTIVDHPYDSTRVYKVETILNAQAGDQLQKEYVDMITEDSMFFCAMVKLKDGRIFCQNYPTYYLTDTTSTTYSWIIELDGSFTKVEGVLTLPADMCYEGPQPTTTWGRYGFTRTLIELDDGTLLGSMYGSYGTVVVESKDEGKTWNYRSTIADSAIGLDQPYINTDGTDITWFEPSIARCADGSLLCVMRTWRNKPMWQCRSYDDGLTWTEPTLMPGMEGKSIYPHLLLLSNGVMAMGTGVPGDTIYFSLDGCGYNWDYCITTYSGDTTGNCGITELSYDEATGTVVLMNVGDKGFNNLSLSGVWGRLVTVTRNHVENPVLSRAVIRAAEERMAPGESVQVSVDSIFNTDSAIISEGYTIEWYSLTPLVASVDQTGNVTAKGVGTAKIQAVVTYEGKTVMSNEVTIEIRDRDVMDYLEITPTAWVLKPGQDGSLTCEAFNYFGQEFVSRIRREEYINGNVNEPKQILGDVQWSFASMNPELLEVDPVTGDYRALNWGTVDLQVTAVKDDVTLVKNVTMLIESNQWVMEDFESGEIPEGTIYTDCVSISDEWSWSGTHALYLNDDSTTLTPTIRYPLPESRGMILEFMMFTESVEHSPTFGIGAPKEDGSYNYLANVCYIGLLNNPHTVAQGFQAFNGISWSYSNRANNIPHRKWNKVRIEVTTDGYRFYVNGKLLREQEAAAEKEILNTLFFGSGGAAYTGDSYYIDDVRYMVFDEVEPSISMTKQELVHDGDKFYVENTFYFTDIEDVDVTTDAGLLIWTPVQFAGRKVEYDPTFARPGLTDIGNGYYTAKSDVIESGNLGEGFYYCGYVKLADGTYIYTDAKQYIPSATELNFISAAQNFLQPGIGKSKLANAKLTNAQKELQWINLGRQLGIKKDLLNKNLSDEQKLDNWNKSVGYMYLAPEIPADKQVEKDATVFNNTGKTFQIADKISLTAVYEINGNTIANAKQYGTIFWTAEQFNALQGTPSIYNFGDGMDVKMEQHGESGNIWRSVGMQLELEEMAEGEYYMLGYVVDANGNVSYSGVMSYTVEQYVKNMVEGEYTTAEMAELAKRLFAYERQKMKS